MWRGSGEEGRGDDEGRRKEGLGLGWVEQGAG